MRMLLVASTLFLASACGQQSPTVQESPTTTPSGPAPTATTTAGEQHDTEVTQPPPFRVRYDDRELVLHPTTYCFRNGCVDGVDSNPPDIGSPEELRVYVPVREFELSVHAREMTREPRPEDPSFDETCGGRSFELPVEELGDGWYAVRPAGPGAHYDVELFAQGGGDMIGTIRWRTPSDEPLPEPTARLALIADHDGEPDSYGLELAIDDLPETPRSLTARIEVTAANGRSLTFEAVPADHRCESAGDLYFDGPDGPAKEAAGLGGFPFTTTVTLTLDGRVHRATAVYPDDEIEGNEPSVALRFVPGLPR